MTMLFKVLEYHFIDAPKEILKILKRFLYFNLNFFSVPVLLRTFFSRWRRYSYRFGEIWEVGRNTEALVFEVMSRSVGVVLRTFFIALGLITEIIILIIGFIIFCFWIITPIVLIFLLFFGIKLLI